MDVSFKIFSSKKEQIYKFNSVVALPDSLEILKIRLEKIFSDNSSNLELGKAAKKLQFRQLSKKKTYLVSDGESFEMIKAKVDKHFDDFDILCKYPWNP